MVSQVPHSLPGMAARFTSIDRLASSQLSLVTRRQLLEAKFTRSEIASFLRSRALRAIRPGVYATFGSVRDWRQELLAAVLAFDGALASHSSAARLWEFVHRPKTPSTSRSNPSSRRSGGVCTGRRSCRTRTARCGPTFRARLSSGPCATARRFFRRSSLGACWMTGCAGEKRRSRSCRSARPVSTPGPAGASRSSRNCSRIGTSRSIRAGALPSSTCSQVIRDAGLPEPVQQHPVWADGRRYVLDFAWPERRVFVEYYGLAVHSGASCGCLRQRATQGPRGPALVATRLHRRDIRAQIVRDISQRVVNHPIRWSDRAPRECLNATK